MPVTAKSGPLHWCQVLKEELNSILDARKAPGTRKEVRSKAMWELQPDDVCDLPRLIAYLQADDALWAWVGALPSNPVQTLPVLQHFKMVKQLKNVLGVNISKPTTLVSEHDTNVGDSSAWSRLWTLAENRLGVARPLSFNEKNPGDDEKMAICGLANALLGKSRLDEAMLSGKDSTKAKGKTRNPDTDTPKNLDAWEIELDELLAVSDVRLPEEAIYHRNRLLVEKLYAGTIHPVHERRTKEAIAAMHNAAPVALCLSGGGIRSATFGLGILQGLARKGLVDRFDYLSTVSGGGYIGSWLTSWLAREKEPQRVIDGLSKGRRDPLKPEVDQIAHLRSFSNYLTPKLGLLSIDTWTLIATYLRNLLLIWLVLLPPIISVLILPRLWLGILLNFHPNDAILATTLMLGGAITILLLAMLRPIAGIADDDQLQTRSRQLARSGAFSVILTLACFQACLLSCLRAGNGSTIPPIGPLIEVGIGGFLIGSFAYFYRLFRTKRIAVGPRPVESEGSLAKAVRLDRMFLETIAAVATGIGTGAGIWALAVAFRDPLARPGYRPSLYGDLGTELFAAIAPGAYLLLFFVQTTIFIGAAGKRNDDEDREWWARWAAWILVLAVTITFANVIVIFGPVLLSEAPRIYSVLGGVSGLLTLLLGRSGTSPATQAQRTVMNKRGKVANYLLAVAAPIFAVVLLILLTVVTDPLLRVTSKTLDSFSAPHFVEYVRAGVPTTQTRAGNPPSLRLTKRRLRPNAIAHVIALRETQPASALLLGIALLLLSALTSWAVHINRFSMHALYRNRLVRAYLGATNKRRTPNRFTGFDENDNIALTALAKTRPFHVVNIALNLVGGENLAWQQRKAEPFTASPLHAGAARLGFRPVGEYAEGLTLGTSVAISGAAVSPNMGYHTSPAIAFLLTLFNIRLGWWLPNPGFPGQTTYTKHSPWFAFVPILMEAFGQTNSRRPWVYLSDGGHFDNLGLYEMVRRRCHTILVSDAGRDPKVAFEDLGNAIRKIRIDLGIPITIDELKIYSREEGRAGRYHAIGEIHYEAVDDPVNGKAAPMGTLIYLKPAVYRREPADVYNYARENQDFPHESTSDQWFTESQFESYRALGLHVIEEICDRRKPVPASLDDFVARARA